MPKRIDADSNRRLDRNITTYLDACQKLGVNPRDNQVQRQLRRAGEGIQAIHAMKQDHKSVNTALTDRGR